MPAVDFKPRTKKREVLEIEIPDWSEFDHRIAVGEPFVLWRVGYQSLLHHWLDHAINSEVSFLRIYCPGKPHLVRQAMEEATLWPIDWELIPSSSSSNKRTVVPVLGLPPEPISDDEAGDTKTHSPNPAQAAMDDEEPLFADEWELLDYWFALERQCFNRLNFEGKTEDLELWIGRFSHVAPSARLHFPLWIGDNVYIGPDTEIGPYASIGHNSVVEGNSIVVHSKIAEDTFLGAHTHLEAAYLDGNRLVSRKHRSVVTMNDAFVATAIRHINRHDKSGKRERERVYAFGYWFALRTKQVVRRLSFWSPHSREKPAYWESRVCKLIDVILGKRRLFGILPRSEAQLAAHDAEWREVLEAETPGVFSYADTLGCHHVEQGMEPIHAVYQATQPRRHMEKLCREYLHELIFDQSPAGAVFEDQNDDNDIEIPTDKS